MLRLSTWQRAVLVQKLPDTANLGVGALFFGQFLSERAFSVTLALSGMGMWAALIGFSLLLARRTR